MPGLVPGIHVFLFAVKTWMAGTSPAMTIKHKPLHHGVMETGEKSTNQLLGCTNPLIFGLIARGPTSCAT